MKTWFQEKFEESNDDLMNKYYPDFYNTMYQFVNTHFDANYTKEDVECLKEMVNSFISDYFNEEVRLTDDEWNDNYKNFVQSKQEIDLDRRRNNQ